MAVTRRDALGGLGLTLAVGIMPRVAHATVARGISLEALSKRSEHILVGTPLASSVRYETIGGQRRIVTDTRVRIDETLAQSAASDSEILVRTLGGVLNGVGELVHGEAELVLNERSVVFLRKRPDGILHLQGMAQGHYPLWHEAKRSLLQASPKLPEMLSLKDTAVARLSGREVGEARRLILEALAR
jgi:hypothetical protein